MEVSREECLGWRVVEIGSQILEACRQHLACVEQRALERQEVAGTSLQDRFLQRLQQAALGQRGEHALWSLCVLHGLRRGLASKARCAMFQVCAARSIGDDVCRADLLHLLRGCHRE